MQRKIVISLAGSLLFLMMSLSAFSQGLRLGLHASPSLSWFKPDTEEYTSEGIRVGVSYGLLSEFLLAEQYSFATGISVRYQGGILQYPTAETINDQEYLEKERTYRLQNLEVPLTLKMKTREIGYNTYFAVFGFGGSVNLRSKADDQFIHPDPDMTGISRTDLDIKSEIPLFRISMIMGIGFEHSLGGNTSIVTSVNFNNGFTNNLKGVNRQLDKKQNAISNFVELNVGILF
ncbi:MAG: porin family protein [Bacteroidales bacterium]